MHFAQKSLAGAALLAFAAGLFLASPQLAPHAARAQKKIARLLGLETSPPLPPLPEKFFPQARMEMTDLFGGIPLRLELKSGQGGIASRERTLEESYRVDVKFEVQVPEPNHTLADLQSVNPLLPELLPALPSLLETAEVSPAYHSLYRRKIDLVRQSVLNFKQVPTRHNFFDCDTILKLKSPESGRKALLIQAEMDVLTDGSDSDRTLDYDISSRWFQPFTSYAWRKRTTIPNPFIRPREEELARLLASLDSLESGPRRQAQNQISRLRQEIAALKARSSLVATLDPFIVLPIFMFEYADESHAPEIGDYAVVIHGSTLYPAIVGDAGPNSKIGEASRLICQAVDPASSGSRRAVNDLSVTYLVFPGSREKEAAPPDLAAWRARCESLLGQIGGHGGTLHDWQTAAAPATGAPPVPAPGAHQ
jgi:hypothetical protein